MAFAVDVIIPYGHSPEQPARQENLKAVVSQWRCAMGGSVELILSEMGPTPTMRAWARKYCDQYVYQQTPASMRFSPALAQNAGVMRRRPRSDLLHIHQADFVVAADHLSVASYLLNDSAVPVAYPHWGEAHLSQGASTLARAHPSVAQELYADVLEIYAYAAWTSHPPASGDSTAGLIRHQVPDIPAARRLVERCVAGDVNCEEPWGADHGASTSWGWPAPSDRFDVAIRIAGGPRASASYFISEEVYCRIGGAWPTDGWGYEDLLTFEKLRTEYGISQDWTGVSWDGRRISSYRPLVHLWHELTHPSYYGSVGRNREIYDAFVRMGERERRAVIHDQQKALAELRPQRARFERSLKTGIHDH